MIGTRRRRLRRYTLIAELVKKKYKKSQSRKIYEKIRYLPPVRLFFDFEYAGEKWRKGFFGKAAARLTNKIRRYTENPAIKVGERGFAALLSVCLLAGFSRYTNFLLIPLAVIAAALFCPLSRSGNFLLLLFMCFAISAFFALIFPFSVFIYIIYVEIGVIFFFIIKYTKRDMYFRIVKYAAGVWAVAALLLGSVFDTAALTVMLMPYGIEIFRHGKFRKYIYAAVILSIGFFALTRLGPAAVMGGSAGIILLILSGEYYLLPAAALSAPFVIIFGTKLFEGDLAENIIRAGFFVWKYGFRGVSVSYDIQNAKNLIYLKVITDAAAAFIFLFFWYVLRLSRSVIIKIFKKDTKNKHILRGGLGSIVGFSVYTFMAENGNMPVNIILYLFSAALLKRAYGGVGRPKQK